MKKEREVKHRKRRKWKSQNKGKCGTRTFFRQEENVQESRRGERACRLVCCRCHHLVPQSVHAWLSNKQHSWNFSSNTFVCELSFFCDSLSTAYTRLWAMAGFILQEKLLPLLCNGSCISVIEDLDACLKVKARNMECLSRPVLCCPWDKIKWFDRSPFNCGERFHSCLFLYLETALKAKNIFLTTWI